MDAVEIAKTIIGGEEYLVDRKSLLPLARALLKAVEALDAAQEAMDMRNFVLRGDPTRDDEIALEALEQIADSSIRQTLADIKGEDNDNDK